MPHEHVGSAIGRGAPDLSGGWDEEDDGDGRDQRPGWDTEAETEAMDRRSMELGCLRSDVIQPDGVTCA
jgi:hypothetical protein